MWDSLFHALSDSPQAYVIVFGLAALDAVFPVVPSETGLILAGYLCTQAPYLSLWLVILVAAAGAFVGDSASYALGRYLGRPILSSRVFGGPRTRKATVWAETQLTRRGGMLIVVARFIPGGRTAVTLTCGITRYRYARFAMFDAVAALIWAVYGALLGYLGGRMFQDKAWAALLVAFGIAGSITLATEAWQRWRAT